MGRLHTVDLGVRRLIGGGTRGFSIVSAGCQLPSRYAIGASSPLGQAGVKKVQMFFYTLRIDIDEGRDRDQVIRVSSLSEFQLIPGMKFDGFTPTLLTIGGNQRDQGWTLPSLCLKRPGCERLIISDILKRDLPLGERVRVRLDLLFRVEVSVRGGDTHIFQRHDPLDFGRDDSALVDLIWPVVKNEELQNLWFATGVSSQGRIYHPRITRFLSGQLGG